MTGPITLGASNSEPAVAVRGPLVLGLWLVVAHLTTELASRLWVAFAASYFPTRFAIVSYFPSVSALCALRNGISARGFRTPWSTSSPLGPCEFGRDFTAVPCWDEHGEVFDGPVSQRIAVQSRVDDRT